MRRSLKKIESDFLLNIMFLTHSKDISLPLQLQKAMATEAESYRLANAKIIVARAEIEATRNLQKATKLLTENPYCMQVGSIISGSI